MVINLDSFIILVLPLIGTSIGSFLVLFLKNTINGRLNKCIIGFSIGVMLASSIWSLLIPSIELSKKNNAPIIYPTVCGLVLGIFFLAIIEYITRKINNNSINKSILAISIHNFPEGMAVGTILMGALLSLDDITMISAFSLSLGIALQNIPEGAIVSIPLKLKGYSKKKSLFIGILSGVIEPIAGVLSLLFFKSFSFLLPYVLSFASGAMFYVIIEDLIPETKEGEASIFSLIGFTIGFSIMMVMDVVL